MSKCRFLEASFPPITFLLFNPLNLEENYFVLAKNLLGEA